MQVSRKGTDKASSFLPANKRSEEPQICHDDIEGEAELNSRELGMGREYIHISKYVDFLLHICQPFKRVMIVQVNIITIYKSTIQSILAKGGSGLMELFFIIFY